MLTFKNSTPINSFGHKMIIEKLTEPTYSGLSDKEKPAIKDGFCYTLALDWLFNPNNAQKHYFDKSINNAKSALKVLNTPDNLVYYTKLAQNFKNYKEYIAANCKKTIKCISENGTQYTSIPYNDLLKTDNNFANLWYQKKFDAWASFNGINQFKQIFTNNFTQQANCCLFNFVYQSTKKPPTIYRHTFAARLKINGNGYEEFYFFEPQYGLYTVKNNNPTSGGEYYPASFVESVVKAYAQAKEKHIFLGGYFSYKNYVINDSSCLLI